MATPQPREESATAATESRIQLPLPTLGWWTKVRQFGRDVALEMKKVSWPMRQEVIGTTMVVIVVIFFFAFFLYGSDIVLSYLIRFIEGGAKRLFS